VPLGEEIPLASTRASKRGIPLRNRYFTTVGSSSVKTVADRHRLAAIVTSPSLLIRLITICFLIFILFFLLFSSI